MRRARALGTSPCRTTTTCSSAPPSKTFCRSARIRVWPSCRTSHSKAASSPASTAAPGAFRRGPRFAAARPITQARIESITRPELYDRIEALARIARAHGGTLVDLSLSWLASRPAVACVPVGATTPEQVATNAKAIAWELPTEVGDEVDDVVGVGRTTWSPADGPYASLGRLVVQARRQLDGAAGAGRVRRRGRRGLPGPTARRGPVPCRRWSAFATSSTVPNRKRSSTTSVGTAAAASSTRSPSRVATRVPRPLPPSGCAAPTSSKREAGSSNAKALMTGCERSRRASARRVLEHDLGRETVGDRGRIAACGDGCSSYRVPGLAPLVMTQEVRQPPVRVVPDEVRGRGCRGRQATAAGRVTPAAAAVRPRRRARRGRGRRGSGGSGASRPRVVR